MEFSEALREQAVKLADVARTALAPDRKMRRVSMSANCYVLLSEMKAAARSVFGRRRNRLLN